MRVQRNHGRRLSAAERLEIQRRVGSGATHAAVAVAVGCSTKSVQRLLIRTGGLVPRPRQTLQWMKPCEVFAQSVATTD